MGDSLSYLDNLLIIVNYSSSVRWIRNSKDIFIACIS